MTRGVSVCMYVKVCWWARVFAQEGGRARAGPCWEQGGGGCRGPSPAGCMPFSCACPPSFCVLCALAGPPRPGDPPSLDQSCSAQVACPRAPSLFLSLAASLPPTPRYRPSLSVCLSHLPAQERPAQALPGPSAHTAPLSPRSCSPPSWHLSESGGLVFSSRTCLIVTPFEGV